jgi:DNA-binding transcriptional regulator YdaS (Cro superfamily)
MLCFLVKLCFNLRMISELVHLYPSKSDCAKAWGVSPQFLRQLEIGERPIPPRTALRINELHGTPLEDLCPSTWPPSNRAA